MRKRFILFGTTVLLMACNANHNFQISGNIQGVEPNTIVYLEKLDPFTNDIIKIDSTAVNAKGYFEFKGDVQTVDMAYISVKHRVHKAPFFMEPGQIVLQYDLNSNEQPTATGSISNDQYLEYNQNVESLRQKLTHYRDSTMQAHQEATKNNDLAKVKDLEDRFKSISQDITDYIDNYPKQNPNSIVNLITLYQSTKSPSTTKEQFLEKWELVSPELQTTPIAQKVDLHIQGVPTYQNKIGQKAPDFEALTPQGTTLSLKQALGKVTIVDFWAAWCAPCRLENPNLVAIYNDYHSKGLNILGVSLDKDKDKWLDAIKQDKLPWYQISNLMYFKDPIAKLYGITSIPATYILDQNGTIIAKDLKGEELRKKIAELLD